jgi:hypothetical protein
VYSVKQLTPIVLTELVQWKSSNEMQS